ncbi:MAG: SpoIIE family protein phosphatase [Cyclobacteriaceae bacterium]|nr:SpoIIE family protein phosphatase [Cyclobacteriaceae bacterium]
MEIVQILQKVPLFSGLDSHSLSAITPLFEAEVFPAKSKILREGEFGDSMFIIANGEVSVTKFSDEGKEILITNMKSGSYFGEVALIDNQPRSANINAENELSVLRLRKSAFEKLLIEDKTFAINFYRNLLNETLERMRETATNLTSSKTVLDQKSTRLDQMDAELSDAKIVQDYFISQDPKTTEIFKQCGIRETYIYKPFLEVGGDFLNLKSFENQQVGFIIADVMGHGISAALATGVLRSAFAIFSKSFGSKPVALMNHLNEHFYEIFTSLFATSYYALIDIGNYTVTLSKGGHMHPLIWQSRTNTLLSVDLPGPGLGIIPKAQFHALTITIEKGDKMLFFTDGIIEQRNYEGEMFSEERLKQLYIKYCQERHENIVQSIYDDFTIFNDHNELQDDITLFLLEF